MKERYKNWLASVKRKKEVKRYCLVCKKVIPLKLRLDAKCCSITCREKFRKGLRDGKYNKNGHINKNIRSHWERQVLLSWWEYECQLCTKLDETGSELVIHHIIPLENGGLNHWSNITVLCKQCHILIHKSKGVYL